MRIDLQINEEGLEHAVQRARERSIRIPTFAELSDPQQLPEPVVVSLREVGLWEVNPLNIHRASWKNEPAATGGGFGGVNYIEVPKEITGTRARILALVGKWFPTGAHKVGAAFGCLVPRLVTGQFDPTSQKAVWAIDREFLPWRRL